MDDYKLLLEKFWNGSASETEKLQLYKIITEEEEAIKMTLQEESDAATGIQLQPGTSQRILESLHREIGLRASKSIEGPRRSLGLFKWAAALLVMGCAAFISWKLYTLGDHEGQDAPMAAAFTIIDNKEKEIKQVLLDDSTLVQLYPQSSIQLKEPFNRQSIRSITLKGKANFKVKHDAAKPFEVIANNIKTLDIGTEFCIDAPDEHTFSVALKEGSIHVAAMPNSTIRMEERTLKPGDEMHWDFKTKKMMMTRKAGQRTAETPAPGTVAVIKEKLVFEKTPLDQVFSKIAIRSSVPIKFDTAEIKELTFTGTIEPSDKTETALSIICKLNGLYYHKTKQAFIIAKSK